ncbi:small GTP-binding protein [Anaerotaenia torta]|uniref:NYN domain-containing protein n=1 Tax=Anaerotaenia torta TaxID=433293 RepID=UPI003D1EE218
MKGRKKLVVGILAHVDAGKTTLAEAILYRTGSIRRLGRVDHGNTFLDTHNLERARGITIFSKQAVFKQADLEATLLDTPGHVDFSAEMERTLQVLDYAILVISGSDGVQGHTETLWKLLARYQVPVFLFINKMDLEGTDRAALMAELKKRLSDGCVDFSEGQDETQFQENLAVSDEGLLEEYMETGKMEPAAVAKVIRRRGIFPCYFGSALRQEGIQDFLDGLARYTQKPPQRDEFGAKVYKIMRDEQGNRLTLMKITGGSLRVKMLLTNRREDAAHATFGGKEDEVWEEKPDQIRIYSGARYEAVDQAEAGTLCAVTGLSKTYPGQGLGMEAGSDLPVLEPVLGYHILPPPDCDAHTLLLKLRQLEEEDPQLHVVWSEQLKEIHVQLMGEVQVEILKNLISERFGITVEFGEGRVVYKETIAEPVEGVGHFEPLRHYAEVHLLLEPGEPGSGLTLASRCSEDELDRSWQRLILTHLEEKEHIGVLTGSPVTDMKITLIAGRAHQKHTEGGDFRQATYRAVRQGLKKAKSILLEPYYRFRLEIPSETVGRAMSDIQRMNGTFLPPDADGEMSVLTGSAPVAAMRSYHIQVTAYTRGRGRLFCTLKGYEPCHNQEEVIRTIGYDSERDLDNPTGSVFCAHGAGFTVAWDRVEDFMHLEGAGLRSVSEKQEAVAGQAETAAIRKRAHYEISLQQDKELEEIFVRTFGPIKQRLDPSRGRLGAERRNQSTSPQKQKDSSGSAGAPAKGNGGIQQAALSDKMSAKEYLLVDGYNIIFSWEELSELAKDNMDAARNKLMDILCNYQGFKNCILILVFDAYKVKGGIGEVLAYHNIHVVYTKEAETADQYIERVTHEIADKHHVTVATSDALEQMIILGKGALRMSAAELKEEIKRIGDQIRREYLDRPRTGRAYLSDRFTEEIRNELDQSE